MSTSRYDGRTRENLEVFIVPLEGKDMKDMLTMFKAFEPNPPHCSVGQEEVWQSQADGKLEGFGKPFRAGR